MARLQILELPEGTGDDRPPFVLVVDQVPTDEAAFEGLRRDLSEGVANRIGARAVLAFEATIDIPANDSPPNSEEDDVSDADFTEMASAVRRALGIDMTEAGTKMDIAGWLLTACRELEKSEAAREQLRQERDAQAEFLERVRNVPDQSTPDA